ncbi:hypothetical protein PPL_01281 [Heterostelium album PN500]|uniref:Uncharacterized protein n=1 Tax=Heterostelium pallidum (strain ATCC 26659 / Pp 5 / PN500) TaxID=670386 RepID=D3AYL9_HETP5|nr:hypothetical protein PPL_01281 [Heterostelium album PN500]EFA86046.1 hypothetical protein PPL_01281 [Heterostelium album PN500]|eukprot:XP_020438152.1 hypothetical protein PPL_01281 [Heterostelium album PN500]
MAQEDQSLNQQSQPTQVENQTYNQNAYPAYNQNAAYPPGYMPQQAYYQGYQQPAQPYYGGAVLQQPTTVVDGVSQSYGSRNSTAKGLGIASIVLFFLGIIATIIAVAVILSIAAETANEINNNTYNYN